MRCVGVTKNIQRCKNQSFNNIYPYCGHHKWQPIILLFITLPTYFALYFGLYRDYIEPDIINEIIEESIISSNSDLFVKNYVPKQELEFSLTHNITNQSSIAIKNYSFTNHFLVFGIDWTLKDYLKTNLDKRTDYIIHPKQSFRIKDDLIKWESNTKTLKVNRMIGFMEHNFTNLDGKKKYNSNEYYTLVLDTIRNQLSVGYPSDEIIQKIKPSLDSIILNQNHR